VAVRLGPQILSARMARCCELVAALMQRAQRAESVARLRRRERLATATVRLSAGLRANADVHRNRIDRQRERVAALAERSERATRLLLRHRMTSLERCGQLLTALSHRGVLARGFALVRDLEGHPLRRADQVSAGMRLDVEFSDGRVRARAEGSDAVAPGKTDSVPAIKPRGPPCSDAQLSPQISRATSTTS
jgi:exodeoxyribonuclease VII large subunit